MKKFIKTLFWIFIVLFLISGVFKLLGAILNVTFGIIGAIMSFIWSIVFNPVVLILVIIYSIYRFSSKSK